MGDLRQQIESDLEVILECLTDTTYNAISDLMFYHGNDVLVDFAGYIKEHDETISYVKILNSFLLAFDDSKLTSKDTANILKLTIDLFSYL